MAEVETLKAENAEQLEALRIKYLSKKGLIPSLMNDFRQVPAELKKEVGMKINELKTTVQNRINELKDQFETSDGDTAEVDLTRTSAYHCQE